MKYIIHFLKIFLDSLRDTKKIICHFDMIKINGYSIVYKLFFIRFVYSFQFIRNLKKYSEDKSNQIIKPNFTKDFFYLGQELDKIDNQGFSKVLNLNRYNLENIKNEILNNKDNLSIKKKYKFDLFKYEEESEIEYLNRLKNNRVSRLAGVLNINKFEHLKQVVLSNEILNLVSKYLSSNIISINASYFISLPVETDKYEKYENAQFFHWDNDFTKFLKLYIYLSDVNELSGPHVYITGSHKNKKLEHSLARLYSDKEIFESYKKIKTFIGKEGSFFFTDSYGIHKGEPPKKNYRLMLNIHFGNNNIKYHKDDMIIKI